RRRGKPADVARQPIVRVNKVVVTEFVMSFGTEDTRGEGTQLARKILLGEPSVRSGGDVADDPPGRHLHGGWKISTGRSGEDLDFGACGSHPLGELDDIDVHATGVTG